MSVYEQYQKKLTASPKPSSETAPSPQQEGIIKRAVRAVLPQPLEQKFVGPKPETKPVEKKPKAGGVYGKYQALGRPAPTEPLTPEVKPSPTAKPFEAEAPEISEEENKKFAQDQLLSIEKRIAEINQAKPKVPKPVPGPVPLTAAQHEEQKKLGKEEVGELKALELARDSYRDYIEGRGDKNFLQDFTKGIKDTFREGEKLIPFAGSVESLSEATSIYKAVKKLENKQQLSKYEQALLQKHQAKNLPKRSVGYLVGSTMAQLPTYALEFMATGGVFSYTRAGVTAGVAKFAPKFAASKIGSISTKVAGTVIGGLAQSQTNLPKISSDTASYMIPNYGVMAGKDGELIGLVDKNSGSDFKTALGQSIGTNAVEYISERAGVVVEKPIELLQRAVLGKYIAKHGISKVGKFLKEGIAWDGIIGEIFEEELAELGQAPLEGREYKNPFTTPEGVERLLVETLAIAGFGGLGKVSDKIIQKVLTERPSPEREEAGGVYQKFKEEGTKPTTTPELAPRAPIKTETKIAPELEKVFEPAPETAQKEEVLDKVDEAVELTPEMEEEAENDWDDNHAEAFGKLSEQLDKLEQEFKKAKGEAKDELAKQGQEIGEKMAQMENDFIDKWQALAKKEKAPVEEFKEKLPKTFNKPYLERKDEAEEALGNIFQEMEAAEAGKRIPLPTGFGGATEFHGIQSSFPKWVPEELRSRKLFDKVMGNLMDIENLSIPAGRSPKQRALFNAIMDELDSRIGTNTAKVREAITKQYEAREEKRTTKPVRRGAERGEGRKAEDAGFKKKKEEIKSKYIKGIIEDLESERHASAIIAGYGASFADDFIEFRDALVDILNEEGKGDLAQVVLKETKDREPIYTGGAENAAIGAFQDSPLEVAHLNTIKPIEFPELVDIAREIAEVPQIVKFPRFAQVSLDENGEITTVIAPKKLGQHQGGKLKLDFSVFKKENLGQITQLLAHEIGHLVDWLPDKVSKRGNILGRLFTLKNFLKSTYGEEGALDLKEIRNDVTKEVLKEEGYTFGDMVTGKLPIEVKKKIKDRMNEYITEHAITKKEIRDELYAVSKYWRPFDEEKSDQSYRNYRGSSSELYADAISVLLNSPGTLERMAPKFFENFFEELDRKPMVKEAYFEIQALYNGDRTAIVKHRREGVRGMFDEGDYKSKEWEKSKREENNTKRRNIWFKVKREIMDVNAPIIDRVRKMEKDGKYVNPDENPVYYLEERNYLGGKIKGLMEEYVQPVYEEMTRANVSWTDFSEALFYERIVSGDRSEIANPRGLTPNAVEELYDTFKKEMGQERMAVLNTSMDKFRGLIKSVAEEAYKEGLYSEELYKKMQENPAYVTFQVVEHIEDGVSAKVSKQIGTLKDVNNVANSSILKVIATVRAIERNKVTRSVVQFLNTNFPEDIKPAKTVFTGRGLRAIEDKKEGELIMYAEKGKYQGFYVDEYIAASVRNTSTGYNNAIISGLRFLNSNWFRPVFITFNLGFQSFNLIRDFWRFYKNIPTMTLTRSFRLYVKSLPASVARGFGLKNEVIEEMEQQQILSITFSDLVAGRESDDAYIDEIMRKTGLGKKDRTGNIIMRNVRTLLNFISDLGSTIETIPKVAGYYELKEKIPAREMRSYVRRKVGSPDFLARGEFTPATNAVFLFSNAVIQGIRSDVEVAIDPKTRAGYWWKTVAINFVPKILMSAVLYGLFGDELQKMMQDASEYDRTNYTIIPVGQTENGKTIYIRIPSDETGRLMGGMFWKLISFGANEQNIFRDIVDIGSLMGGQVPGVTPVIKTGYALSQFVTGQNPYDFFRGRPVLTDDQFAAGGKEALVPFVGWLFEQMGGSILYKFYSQGTVPKVQSPGEKFIRLPIINNILGRFIRISDYGQIEKAKDILETQQADEARKRLEEKRIINSYIDKFNEDPKAQFNVRKYEEQLVEEVLGHQPTNKEEAAEAKRLVKKFQLARSRSEADPRITTIMDARTNDQKEILLKEYKEQLGPEWKDFLDTLVEEKIISRDLARRVNNPSVK